MPADLGSPVIQQELQPDRVVQLEVFPTGDGPADEEVCRGFQFRLESVQDDLKRDMLAGDGDSAMKQSEALDNLEDMAMEAGCAIAY